MTDTPQDTVWPLPKFYFSVEFGDVGTVAFQQVTGLEIEAQPIEYRAGNSQVCSTIKMPGLRKSENVTLTKGICADGKLLRKWLSDAAMNTITPRTVTIRLLETDGAVTMIWRLANAFPVKVGGVDPAHDGTGLTVDRIKLAHEGLSMSDGH